MSPGDLYRSVSKISETKYFSDKFGLSKVIINNLIDSGVLDIGTIKNNIKIIMNDTKSKSLTAGIILVAMLKSHPLHNAILKNMSLELHDLYDGIRYLNSKGKKFLTSSQINALDKINQILSRKKNKSLFFTGEDATGKTTVLKNITFDNYYFDASSLDFHKRENVKNKLSQIFADAGAKYIILDNADRILEEHLESVDCSALVAELIDSGRPIIMAMSSQKFDGLKTRLPSGFKTVSELKLERPDRDDSLRLLLAASENIEKYKKVSIKYNALKAATTINIATDNAAVIAKGELLAAQAAEQAAIAILAAAQADAAIAGANLAAAEQAAATATTELAASEAAAAVTAAQAAVATTAATVAGAELAVSSASAAVSLAGLAVAEEGASVASVALGIAANATGVAIRFALLGPIILVAGAIAGLIAYFTKTKEGSDKFGQGMAYLGGVFMGLIKPLAEFGKLIFDAFSKPQILLDLLVENVTNRFKAIGLVAKSFAELIGAAFTGNTEKTQKAFTELAQANLTLITGISKETQDAVFNGAKAAGEAAMEAEKRTQVVQGRIRELMKTNADLKNDVEKYDKLSDNASLTFAQRQKAATTAIAKQRQLNANNLSVLKEQLNIAKIKQEYEGKTTANMDEIAKLQSEMTSALQEGNTKIYDLENKQAQIRINETTSRLNGEKADLETRLMLIKGNAEAELQIKKDLIDKNAEIAASAAGLSAKEIKAIQTKANTEKEQLDKDYALKKAKNDFDIVNQGLEKELQAVEKGSLEEIQLKQKQGEILYNQELTLAALEITDKEQLAKKKTDIDLKYNQSKIDLAKQAADKIKQLEDQRYNNQLTALKLVTTNEQVELETRLNAQAAIYEQERQKRIENASLTGEDVTNINEEYRQKDVALNKQKEEAKYQQNIEIAQQTFGFVTTLSDLQYQADLAAAGDNAQEKEKIEKAYAARQKRLKLFEILLNQSVAIAKTLAEAPFGLNFAASIAVGAQIAALAGQVIALKFNKGGKVPGQGDTDTVPALLTPGEVVINKRAAAQNIGLLDRINRSTGGAALIPQRLNSGGIVLPVSGNQNGLTPNDVMQIVNSMPAPVVEVKQIIRGINNQVNVTQSATL
jgi:hypothetical protein